MLRNTRSDYGSLAKSFHWVIALLIFIMLPLGYFMKGISSLFSVHQWIGLTVLALTLARLVWMLNNVHPQLPPIPTYEKILARAAQTLLYICLFGMPLTGWIMSTAFSVAPHVGGFSIPFPGVPLDSDFGRFVKSIHNTMAIVLIGLIVLHTLGALKHFIIDKNNVLQSMLPKFKDNNVQ